MTLNYVYLYQSVSTGKGILFERANSLKNIFLFMIFQLPVKSTEESKKLKVVRARDAHFSAGRLKQIYINSDKYFSTRIGNGFLVKQADI